MAGGRYRRLFLHGAAGVTGQISGPAQEPESLLTCPDVRAARENSTNSVIDIYKILSTALIACGCANLGACPWSGWSSWPCSGGGNEDEKASLRCFAGAIYPTPWRASPMPCSRLHALCSALLDRVTRAGLSHCQFRGDVHAGCLEAASFAGSPYRLCLTRQ